MHAEGCEIAVKESHYKVSGEIHLYSTMPERQLSSMLASYPGSSSLCGEEPGYEAACTSMLLYDYCMTCSYVSAKRTERPSGLRHCYCSQRNTRGMYEDSSPRPFETN